MVQIVSAPQIYVFGTIKNRDQNVENYLFSNTKSTITIG